MIIMLKDPSSRQPLVLKSSLSDVKRDTSAFLLTAQDIFSILLSSTYLWKVSGGTSIEYLKCHITEASDIMD